MKVSGKVKRRFGKTLIAVAIVFATPMFEGGKPMSGAHNEDAFAGKEIVCVIDLCDDMYSQHGLEAGLNYQLAERFADDNRCEVKIINAGKKENWLDSLKQGKADIVIMHNQDSLDEGILLSHNMDENTVWGISDDKYLEQVNLWISHMTSHEEYSKIKAKYSRVYNPIKRAENGVVSNTLSPYDSIIKKYAAELGWDWRMLAAVIYQESKFSINSTSHRGATGLMQVMPRTAEYYGVSDLLDPEENIKAGTSHLKRLQKMFSKYDLTHEELIKFTLAAYNAGEGRISDCRNLAAAKGFDNSRWDEIVKVIPMMREDSVLEDESVKLGKFQGHETIDYIDNVLAHYHAICQITSL
jgi:membrane-bound lytic murein transglycosylase MltF